MPGLKTEARAARMQKTDEQAEGPTTPQATRISGTVHLADELAAGAQPGMTLFVAATDPSIPGPPLALVKLRVETWPVPFVLDDADAMIPGRTFSSATRIQLEARLSPSGAALPGPGDLVGKLENVDPRTDRSVRISIDRRIG